MHCGIVRIAAIVFLSLLSGCMNSSARLVMILHGLIRADTREPLNGCLAKVYSVLDGDREKEIYTVKLSPRYFT